MKNSFLAQIEQSFKNHWDLPALSDYKGTTLHYKDVARRIAKLHILFEECGLKKGDKVAICGRNQANWGVVFFSALTYGAVVVPILHEFKADNIHHIVNHSEARILFVGDVVWESINEREMPKLEAIVLTADFSIVHSSKPSIHAARERLNELFGKKYPKNFRPEHIAYHNDEPEELAIINYTSGTTGFSKGVMLPYRSLLSNLLFAQEALPELTPGTTVVAMLPMAHMYGMMFEFIYEIVLGCHVHFLTRIPTPKIIMDAFAEIKPGLIISVPLIIEKIYKKQLQPLLRKTSIKMLLKLPVFDQKIKKKILTSLNKVFGNNFQVIVVGGAAFNHEAEAFFKTIGFQYTIGYGMTECGPLITYEDWKHIPLHSCGKVVARMQVKIDSPNPAEIPGEVLVKGDNVMIGYYRNEAATKDAFTKDGWMKTGDLAVIDQNGYLYIKGRSKNMILSSSGQNVYPEELEEVINNMSYVSEALVVEKDGKLVALIYPDYEQINLDNIADGDLARVMEDIRVKVNAELPSYAQIASVKLYPEEFEKTPKRSIKRFLYQNI